MDHGSDGDVTQRQVVAGLDVSSGTRFDDVALAELVGSDDVTLRSIHVVEECDSRGAVGVVLDVCDLRVHAVLVVATEIDDAVLALVASTDVAGRDATRVVATTGLGKRTEERLLRRRSCDLGEVSNRRTTTAGGSGLVLTNSHCSSVLFPIRQP